LLPGSRIPQADAAVDGRGQDPPVRAERRRDGRPARSALTAIYFLLPRGQINRWHRVRSDEIWTHLEGAAIALWCYDGDVVTRSDLAPLDAGSPVVVVPRGTWQAAEVLGEYALVACFVAPGFEFDDFSLMADDPVVRGTLQLQNPEAMRLI